MIGNRFLSPLPVDIVFPGFNEMLGKMEKVLVL